MLRLYVFFLLFQLTCHGQSSNNVIEVIYEINRDDFGLGQTRFTYQLLVGDNTYNYHFKELRSTSHVNYTNHKYYSYHLGDMCSAIDYQRTNFPDNVNIVIKDELPLLEWQIENKTFSWGDYQCKKAVTNYRGRVITVYFTEDIPISIGPNNLNGLPGAVVYASSHDQDYEIKAISIKKIARPDNFVTLDRSFDNIKLISKKEHVKSMDEHATQVGELARIRLESNTSNIAGQRTTFELMALGRHTLELYYEWELEKKNK